MVSERGASATLEKQIDRAFRGNARCDWGIDVEFPPERRISGLCLSALKRDGHREYARVA